MAEDSTEVKLEIRVAVFKYEFKSPAPEPMRFGTPKRIPLPDTKEVLYGFWVTTEGTEGVPGKFDYYSISLMAKELDKIRRANRRGNEIPRFSYVGPDEEPRIHNFITDPLKLLPKELSELEVCVDQAFKEQGMYQPWTDYMRL